MKLINVLILISFLILNSCVSRDNTSDVAVSIPGISEAPKTDSGNASVSEEGINNLELGILPTSDPEEQTLTNLLNRNVVFNFPIKLGILLYKNNTNLNETKRNELVDNFVSKLKNNNKISEVIKISNNLLSTKPSVEDIRKLGARFQVSQILIINDNYVLPQENKEEILIPIDIIRRQKNWKSSTNIEVFNLDILTGVFIFSVNSNEIVTKKYNKEISSENKDDEILNESAVKSWDNLLSQLFDKFESLKNTNNSSVQEEQ